MTDDSHIDEAKRMRVVWDRGINHLGSFYTMLDTKRKQIGDAALSDWCFYELHISLSIILRVSEVLDDADKTRVREELARAAEFDKQQKQKEREAVEARKREEAVEKARLRVEQAKRLRDLAEEEKKIKANTARIKKPKQPKSPKGGGSRRSTPAPSTNIQGDIQPDPMIAPALEAFLNFNKKVEEIKQVRHSWVDASLVLAGKLSEAKQKYSATQNLSKWLDANNLRQIKEKERAILIKMGSNVEAARQLFANKPESMSLREVWNGRVASTGNSTFSEEDQGVSDISHDLPVELTDDPPQPGVPIQ